MESWPFVQNHSRVPGRVQKDTTAPDKIDSATLADTPVAANTGLDVGVCAHSEVVVMSPRTPRLTCVVSTPRAEREELQMGQNQFGWASTSPRSRLASRSNCGPTLGNS